jgi:hypothetical protein
MDPEQNLSSLVMLLEEQRNSYKKKCQELEAVIEAKNETISKVRLNLKYEKFKNHVLSNLLSTHTALKIEDIFQENKDEINIHNFENGNIPIIVHDFLGTETKQYSLNTGKKNLAGKNLPGKNFRTVKNRVSLTEEKPEEQEEKIKQVEKDIEKLAQKHSVKEIEDSIDASFQEVEKSRVYKKCLENIRIQRQKLLGKLNISEYTSVVKKHIHKLEGIFSKRRYDSKKASASIECSLSPLDKRLVFSHEYYNSVLDADDIERYKNALDIHMNYSKRYIPYSQTELYEKFCDYSMAVFTLENVAKRVLVNPYGFPNIVYLFLSKNEDDPYSFYVLEKIEASGKRCWQMDCRLDNFTRSLSQYLTTFCVKLFRKIYFDIFSDNAYREDYREKALIASQDCEQLLSNILILSRPRKFGDILRKILVSNCTIKPSQNDKFNLTADDPLNKRQFHQDEDGEETKTILKQLFDGIEEDDIRKFL